MSEVEKRPTLDEILLHLKEHNYLPGKLAWELLDLYEDSLQANYAFAACVETKLDMFLNKVRTVNTEMENQLKKEREI